MKIKCIAQTGDQAVFLLPGRMKPVPGNFYNLEKYHEGSEAQNKVFHALIAEYYNSGMHSYNAPSLEKFKKLIKRHHGMGFESVAYSYVEAVDVNGTIEYKSRMEVVEKYNDIPEEIRNDPECGLMTRGILKSWTEYTKQERTATINNLISEMKQAGINTPKFEEILKGIDSTVDNVKKVFGGTEV